MKFWITKYALTSGILEIDARICESVSPDMIEDLNSKNTYYHGEGKNWHRTRESAITMANKMRLKKISSLQKQIETLIKKSF